MFETSWRRDHSLSKSCHLQGRESVLKFSRDVLSIETGGVYRFRLVCTTQPEKDIK